MNFFMTNQFSNNVITSLDIFTNTAPPTHPPPPPPLPQPPLPQPPQQPAATTPNPPLSRYESQKRRDWLTFCQYLRNHRPPLPLSLCSGAHVLEFLKYLDQFGKTKVHNQNCPFFGIRDPPAPCPCPLRQAWGSLDALIGRLRAAYEEHGGGKPEINPFGARAVRIFLRDVREFQSKSRGVSYEKKRKRPNGKQKIDNNNVGQMNRDEVQTSGIYGKMN